MNSRSLKRWQTSKIQEPLSPALGYLTRLKRRMELTGFPPDDTLYVAAVQAQRAMQDLLVELHYLSCENGVGRPESD